MKPIAILSDIHANLPALLAVLREVQTSGAARVIFLGDLVGYGASPAECVAWVRKLGGDCVMGNHDVEVENVRRPGFRFYDPEWQQRGYQAGLAHAAKSLDMEQAGWLARLPYTMTIPGAVVAHGSWNDPENFNSIEDAESAAPTLAALRQREFKVVEFRKTEYNRLKAAKAIARAGLPLESAVRPIPST